MFITYIALYGVPNVHLLGMLIAAFTLTYRVRALIPVYVYVALYGIFYGAVTMIPFLYIWLPLWGMFMIAGRFELPVKVKVPLYMILCALHGLSFGILYSPAAVLMFGIPLSFNSMLAWIVAGLPFDMYHALGNLAAGILIVPLCELLKKLNRQLFATPN